jgi:hypothetical protein
MIKTYKTLMLLTVGDFTFEINGGFHYFILRIGLL